MDLPPFLLHIIVPAMKYLTLMCALSALAAAPCSFAANEQTPLPSASSGITSENYVISPLDVIRFRVLGEADTDTQVRISNDGTVSLPYIGLVKVSGMTLVQVREFLTLKYKDGYYVNPQVEFSIVSYKERRVNVQGMVNSQGFVVLPPEEKVSLMGAIAMAGGWSNSRLAAKTVKLIRTLPDGTTKTFEIDTTKINPDDWPIEDGDMIIVPERTW